MFTSTVFPTQIGKSPHVPQSNCITHARQEEIKFAHPCFSGRHLLFRLLGLHVQGFGLVVVGGHHLVQFRDLSVRFGAVRRHVSGFGEGPGGRTGDFSTGPRRQQLRGLFIYFFLPADLRTKTFFRRWRSPLLRARARNHTQTDTHTHTRARAWSVAVNLWTGIVDRSGFKRCAENFIQSCQSI